MDVSLSFHAFSKNILLPMIARRVNPTFLKYNEVLKLNLWFRIQSQIELLGRSDYNDRDVKISL